MSYATASDLKAAYPERDLIQITDPEGAVIVDDKLEQALAAASAKIDGYLEGRYTLPLAKPPSALKYLCCDIAMYEMQKLRPADDIKDARDRMNDAIRFLERVADGKVTLGLAADNTAVIPNEPAVLEAPAPERTFSRREMDSF